ncbi:MAG: endonuclease III [Brevinematales bacterium]|nr:endonuclease III [Brevinematales bacterium]
MTPTETAVRMLKILEAEFPKWNSPVSRFHSETRDTPYMTLISTLMSARTKDETTSAASARLFAKADTPAAMLELSAEDIEKLIYPVGFYHVKAGRILEISRALLCDYGGRVPDTMEELTALPGVGRKTASLVLTDGYGIPAICVDVHVHRIMNRWGYAVTRTPRETEFALREKLPVEWWITVNYILVGFGQTICKPLSPCCTKCPVSDDCPRRGVDKQGKC